MKITIPKGTKDILPGEINKYKYMIKEKIKKRKLRKKRKLSEGVNDGK